MLNVWTAQYRYPGPNRLDITVKGKDKLGRYFAPTWNMVQKIKNNIVTDADLVKRVNYECDQLDLLIKHADPNKRITSKEAQLRKLKCKKQASEEEYLRQYHKHITNVYINHRAVFDILLNKEQVVLVCFCPYQAFCHRVVLARYLVQLGAVYHGEISDFSEINQKPIVIDNFKGTYHWLSNFAHCKFTHQSQQYMSVEHFYQAQKAGKNEIIKIKHPTNINQNIHVNAREYIATCNNPKTTVRKYKIPLPEYWHSEKVKIMRTGLEYKFIANKHFRKLLLDTENAIIIEGNTWHDNFWGDCRCNTDTTARWIKEDCTKQGENMLGKLIMEIREMIK